MKSHPVWTGCLITTLVVLFFIGLSGIVLALLGKGNFFGPRERVGVVEIKGLLTDSRTAIKQLDRYRDDDSIKAIVLRINSPGGTVGSSATSAATRARTASDTILSKFLLRKTLSAASVVPPLEATFFTRVE